MMKNSLTVFNRSIYDAYTDLGFILWTTVLWWISVLPIITIGPASAALLYVIKLKKTNAVVGPRDYWHGVKKYMRTGLKLSVLYLIIVVPGLSYIFLLLTSEALLAYVFSMVLLYLIVSWHLLFLYMLPMMVEQDITEVILLVKRAFRLLTENYTFTINMAIYLLLLTFLSTIITIALVIWAGWLAITCYNSYLYLMSKYEPHTYSFDSTVSWRGFWRAWK